MGHRAIVAITIVALAGCDLPGLSSQRDSSPPDLTGRVLFPERRIQATMTEVGTKATVSLIDTSDNHTEAATITDNNGAFRLTFTRTFKPDPNSLYYLEAVKGLNSNLPGNNAARVRTLARYQGGWLTLTNLVPSQGIVLDTTTTALSIGAALRHNNPSPFDFSSLIGTVTAASPDIYTAIPALPTSDYTALKGLVDQSLVDNLDPVAGIQLTLPNTWLQVLGGMKVTLLNPASGSIGATISITGTGFNPIVASNSVRFNGIPGVVSASTQTSLTATVPAGATTGAVTVQNGNSSAIGPVFTVTGLLPGIIGTDDSGLLPGGVSDQN